MYNSDAASSPIEGVEVYWWPIDQVAPEDPFLLSVSERLRAARFLVPGAAGQYIAAHAGMRRRLAPYVGLSAQHLQFETGPWGKPYLPQAPRLHFNLSHSGRWAVLACSRKFEVGVDLEKLIEPSRITSSLQHISLSTVERAQLKTSPIDMRSQIYTRLWTAKEAVMKLSGLGVQLPPTAIEVSGPDLHSGQRLDVVLAPAWQDAMPPSLQLHTLVAPDHYVAMLAVGLTERTKVGFQLRPPMVAQKAAVHPELRGEHAGA